MAPAPVYVASPLGFADSTAAYRAQVNGALRSAGLAPLDPWSDPGGRLARRLKAARAIDSVSEQRAALAAINVDIGRRNQGLIDGAAAVLAILDGVDVDSGTAAEIGYAAGIGLAVVGLRTDFRQAGDNAGGVVNLQVEYFARMHGGEVCSSLPRAVAYLRRVVVAQAGVGLPAT